MNIKKLYMSIFVFIMVFSVCIGGVRATNVREQTDTGTGTNYTYGIVCVYGGERTWTVQKSGNIGGGSITQVYPYTYTLKVDCNNTSCERLTISTYGLIKDQDAEKKEIKINNRNILNEMVNYNKEKFGFKKNRGVSKCPDRVGFEYDESLRQSDLDKLNDFGNFLLNSSLKQASLESKQQFSVDEARRINIKSLTDASVSAKARLTRDTTGEGDDATTTEEENNQQSTNRDAIERIKNAADAETSGDRDYGLSSDGSVTCSSLLGDRNVEYISKIILVICVIGVILVVILGATDFIKAIASSDDDALKQAFKRIKNRIISVIVLLLLPALINMLLSFINGNLHFEVIRSDGSTSGEEVSIEIGNVSNCGIRR